MENTTGATGVHDESSELQKSVEVNISRTTPPAMSEAAKTVNPLLVVFAIAVVIVLATLGIFLFVGRTYQSPAQTTVAPAPKIVTAIVGQIHFEGYIPQGSYISIAERGAKSEQFKEVVTGLTPTSGLINWTWNDATSGHNYEVKALLKIQGKTVQESPVQDVSAPATSVILSLVSQQTPPAPTVAMMSGQINVDGYVPTGATLQVLVKTVGSAAFAVVAQNIVAVDNANWAWTNAVEGTTYLVKAQMIDANGAIISTGDTQTTTAPSTGGLLNVTSTVKPPTPVASGISGTITINGNIPSGSYLTLATRPSGTTTFNQVANNIAATNGVGFSWNSAVSDQQYDVQAYLWVNNKPYAASNILTVTAPSTFNNLTINAQQALQAPSSNTISVNCGGQQGGNFQATINYNTQGNLPNAKSFTVVAILASQNTQVVNTTLSPSNPTTAQSLTTTFVFQPGATYYAQYAYSTDGSTFSPLSPSVQFACK